MSDRRYDFGHVPTLEEMESQYRATTPGQWRQGSSTHSVVSVNPERIDTRAIHWDAYTGKDAYGIGDFHHGVDGWFTLMAHSFVPWAIEEIRRLRKEQEPKP